MSASPVRPIRQKPASAISSSARARLTTRTQGTRLERAAGGLGERPGFGRRVPVLGDDAERVERRRRAQDRADIVGVGDMVEHEQRPPVRRLVEQVGEQHVGQPLDLGDQALVRRIARHQPAEIGDVGEGDGNAPVDLERGRRFAGRPDADDLALGIGERRGDGVAPPETGTVLRLAGLARLASHRAAMPRRPGAGKRSRQAIWAILGGPSRRGAAKAAVPWIFRCSP